MNNDIHRKTSKPSGTNRSYPPFWEKSVPVIIACATAAVLVLIAISIKVILEN